MQKGKFRVAKDNILMFFCPGCNLMHSIRHGGNGWTFDGDYENPTLSPSVLTTRGGDRCHLFLKNGKLEFLTDCTHDLSGQTVELPELPEHHRD